MIAPRHSTRTGERTLRSGDCPRRCPSDCPSCRRSERPCVRQTDLRPARAGGAGHRVSAADDSLARKKGRQVSMEPIGRQNFVHSLMVKLNRISLVTGLVLGAVYSLVAYRGAIPTATQVSGTSGVAHVTTNGITGCGGGSGSNDSWPAPQCGSHYGPCRPRVEFVHDGGSLGYRHPSA